MLSSRYYISNSDSEDSATRGRGGAGGAGLHTRALEICGPDARTSVILLASRRHRRHSILLRGVGTVTCSVSGRAAENHRRAERSRRARAR